MMTRARAIVLGAIGIVLLGDDVPAWWAVVVGLALSLAGALYLGGFEGRLQDPEAVPA